MILLLYLTGLFLYSIPLFVIISLILIAIFKKLVVFVDEEDMLYSLIAGLPCGYFTFEVFYTHVYSLSFSRYLALKFELFRFFDISNLVDWMDFYNLSLAFLVLLFLYSLVYAIKHNGSVYLIIISAFCRTQISVLFSVSLFSLIGLIHYYWDGAQPPEVFWVSCWLVGLLATSLAARVGVKKRVAVV